MITRALTHIHTQTKILATRCTCCYVEMGRPGNGQHTAHTNSAEALIDSAAGAQETAGSTNHAEALEVK